MKTGVLEGCVGVFTVIANNVLWILCVIYSFIEKLEVPFYISLFMAFLNITFLVLSYGYSKRIADTD